MEEQKRKLVAAMDLGTNSNRLLIADKEGVPFYRDVCHVALGDGLAENGCFSDEAMDRAICSFMDFKEIMQSYGVEKYRAIATAACRMSNNTEEFRNEVKKITGIEFEVISPFEEARLTLLGAKLNAPEDKKFLFVYDLGGGSTEVTLATNEANPKILETISVPLGARNASEIYKLNNYNKKKAEALENAVYGYLDEFIKKIKKFDYQGQSALVATSSTPLRLTSGILGHAKYDKFAVDGVTSLIKDYDELISHVLTMRYEDRLAAPYIGYNRAKIFVAALIIFRCIYRVLGVDSLTASLKGAQEAIISELIR